MESDGHLLLILHKAPAPGDAERTPRLFWREPEGQWHSSEGGAGLGDLKECLDEYERVTDRLEDLLRATPSAENYFTVLHTATPLLRAARNLHAALQHAREALPEDRNLVVARDAAAEIERTLELIHSDALHGLQFLVASRAEEQARAGEQLVASNHRLNLIVALFLPLTAIASLLGMNVPTGLEHAGPAAFLGILVVALFLGAIVVALVNRPASPRRQTLARLPSHRAGKK